MQHAQSEREPVATLAQVVRFLGRLGTFEAINRAKARAYCHRGVHWETEKLAAVGRTMSWKMASHERMKVLIGADSI